jgi:hypothetical protein
MKRTQVSILATGATGSTGFFFSAAPNTAPNFDTDFGSLFSLFRPIRTTFRFIPALNTNEVASGDTVFMTPMYSVLDPSVTTVPTAEADLLQCGSLVTHMQGKVWSRTTVPSLAVALNSGFALPPASNYWISIGSDPQMNGLRLFVPDMGQAAAIPLGRMMIIFEFELTGTQ